MFQAMLAIVAAFKYKIRMKKEKGMVCIRYMHMKTNLKPRTY